jgi:hypothetical protein
MAERSYPQLGSLIPAGQAVEQLTGCSCELDVDDDAEVVAQPHPVDGCVERERRRFDIQDITGPAADAIDWSGGEVDAVLAHLRAWLDGWLSESHRP